MSYDERLLKADHVNLQDGIVCDSEGMPLAVGEDTKVLLRPTPGVVEEVDLGKQLHDDPDEDAARARDAAQFWASQRR